MINGDFFAIAASTTASIWTRSVILKAPTAYFSFAATTMISFALTIDTLASLYYCDDQIRQIRLYDY
jgi:hypothetical protein